MMLSSPSPSSPSSGTLLADLTIPLEIVPCPAAYLPILIVRIRFPFFFYPCITFCSSFISVDGIKTPKAKEKYLKGERVYLRSQFLVTAHHHGEVSGGTSNRWLRHTYSQEHRGMNAYILLLPCLCSSPLFPLLGSSGPLPRKWCRPQRTGSPHFS